MSLRGEATASRESENCWRHRCFQPPRFRRRQGPQPCTVNPQPAGHPEWVLAIVSTAPEPCQPWGKTFINVCRTSGFYDRFHDSFQLNPWGLRESEPKNKEMKWSPWHSLGETIKTASAINKDCLMKLSVHLPCSSGFPPEDLDKNVLGAVCRRTKHWTRSKYPLTDRGWIMFDGPSVQWNCCCSASNSLLTLCDPMDCSMPGFPVLCYLLELLRLTSIDLVMLSNHLILCRPLLLPLVFGQSTLSVCSRLRI